MFFVELNAKNKCEIYVHIYTHILENKIASLSCENLQVFRLSINHLANIRFIIRVAPVSHS